MNTTKDSGPDEPIMLDRSIVSDLLVSALLTLLVWFEFWGGRLPAGLNGTVVMTGFVGGGIVTIVGLVVMQTDAVRELVESDITFLISMAGLILIGLVLFPGGLPVAAEVGLLVFIWSWPLGKVAVRRFQGLQRD